MGRIIIGADVVPTDQNRQFFIDGDMQKVVGKELKKILDDADFVAVNLEVPLTDKEDKIKKCGPNLIAPTNTIKGYVELGVDLVTLANNHILDQNVSGFKSTVDILDKANIDYVGGGFSYEQAYKPKFYDICGKKIGFYAVCQHEFSWVQDYGAGANGYDPLETFDHIAEAKNNCDYLIVLYHAGIEHFRYLAPFDRKVCRKMVDKGADLVVMQHTHCVNCEEDYNGGKIIYGQGNFVFEKSKEECWQTGMLVTVDIKDDEFKVGYIPIDKHDGNIKIAETSDIMDGYFKRSDEIKDEQLVKDKYYEFGKERINWFTDLCRGYYDSKAYRFIWKLSGGKAGNVLLKDRSRLMLINYIQNPAHKELWENVLVEHEKRETPENK